jgi:hypothetical protein
MAPVAPCKNKFIFLSDYDFLQHMAQGLQVVYKLFIMKRITRVISSTSPINFIIFLIKLTYMRNVNKSHLMNDLFPVTKAMNIIVATENESLVVIFYLF